MEIKNGVYLLDGISGANSYLSVTPDGVCVIDSGMPGNAPKIISQIKALNKTEKDVR